MLGVHSQVSNGGDDEEAHAGIDIYDADIHRLATKLNGLPLALAQAGAFIGLTGLDVKKYIDYFDTTWRDLMKKQEKYHLLSYP